MQNYNRFAVTSVKVKLVVNLTLACVLALWTLAVVKRIACRAVPAQISCTNLGWLTAAGSIVKRIAWQAQRKLSTCWTLAVISDSADRAVPAKIL